MTFTRLAADETIEKDRNNAAGGELCFRIAGCPVPTVAISLEPGQGLVCHLPRVMQAAHGVSIRPWPGLEGRMNLLVNRSEDDEALVRLSAGRDGCIGVFDLSAHGGRLLCPQKSILATGPGVMVSVYSRAREDHDGDLDVLLMEGKGTVFLRGGGDISELRLGAGEQALINLSALAAMRATVDIDALGRSGDLGKTVMARLTGPGQIWLQTGMSDER